MSKMNNLLYNKIIKSIRKGLYESSMFDDDIFTNDSNINNEIDVADKLLIYNFDDIKEYTETLIKETDEDLEPKTLKLIHFGNELYNKEVILQFVIYSPDVFKRIHMNKDNIDITKLNKVYKDITNDDSVPYHAISQTYALDDIEIDSYVKPEDIIHQLALKYKNVLFGVIIKGVWTSFYDIYTYIVFLALNDIFLTGKYISLRLHCDSSDYNRIDMEEAYKKYN